MYRTPFIAVSLILLSLVLVFSRPGSNLKSIECFKECYIMNMILCDKVSVKVCKDVDTLARQYCCLECGLKNHPSTTSDIINIDDL